MQSTATYTRRSTCTNADLVFSPGTDHPSSLPCTNQSSPPPLHPLNPRFSITFYAVSPSRVTWQGWSGSRGPRVKLGSVTHPSRAHPSQSPPSPSHCLPVLSSRTGLSPGGQAQGHERCFDAGSDHVAPLVRSHECDGLGLPALFTRRYLTCQLLTTLVFHTVL